MLKRIKQTASSKKGESYIYVCVLVLFISMLGSVVIMYVGLMAQVQIQKRDVKMKLDSCVSEFATEAFDSIKQGDNYEFMLDLEKLKETGMQVNEDVDRDDIKNAMMPAIEEFLKSQPGDLWTTYQAICDLSNS